MYKYSFKKYIYFLFNLYIFFVNVSADEIKPKKERFLNQYFSQIIWEKVNENNQKTLRWQIDKNQTPFNLENYFQKNNKKNKNVLHLPLSSFLLPKEKINLDFGIMNDKSDFFILNLGLSSALNIDFSSELINSKNNVNNPNKFKSTFLEKGSRTFRGGGTLQIFSKSRGDLITTNLRLSYGQRLDKSGNGYIFGEIINKYKKNDRLSFNLNPRFSYTNFGNIYSISTSLNLSLSPKFEIIPEANINLNNAENNFSLTGRTFLSKNILIDTFVSNSLGIYDMAKQFKSESTKYGVKLKIRL